MFRGNRLATLFSTKIKSKIDVLLLPGPINTAGNAKDYKIICFIESESEIILRVKRQQFPAINPSIIANQRGISSSALFSSALGFLNAEIGYSNLHVNKFMNSQCQKPWMPSEPYIADGCKQIRKAVLLNNGKLTFKEETLEDLTRFLMDLLRELEHRKAYLQ